MTRERLYLYDTTLRDGEQSPGASMTLDEKLRVANALAELKVDVIKAGFAIASNGDFQSVNEIAKQVKGPTICSLARAAKGDIERAAEALEGVLHDGMLIAAGGFGLCGIPELLLNAIRDAGTKDLTFASNNAGVDDFGIGILLQTKQVKKMISSYVGENKEFMRQYLGGELELEFNPQGTLAERMRAGGAGIPGFYTKTGVGTVIAEGKEHKDFDGETYILERGIVADLAIVKAWKADDTGNLVFRKTARNFNPPAAMCGKICIAEVEEIVPRGSLGGDAIHLPGIYVHRIIQGDHEKRIEQRTVRTA